MRDTATIKQVLSDLENELAEKMAEVETLRAGVEALCLMLGGPDESPRVVKKKAAPSGPEAQPEDGPRGREAVQAVLEERAGEWVGIGELTDELVNRGWVESKRPREAVRTSADRLSKEQDSPVEKGRGKYRLPLQPDRRVEVESPTLDSDTLTPTERSEHAAATNIRRLMPE